MQRITFHNNRNGLECTFATDTPRALLSAFDGNSLGAEFIQYKPVGFDGSKTSSYTFNARTITFTADWYAVEGGKYSRAKALAEWEKMQYAFAPGYEGTLTWTNGTETRTINCYANETPALHEKARGLFSADFTLTADYPFWCGSLTHYEVITHDSEDMGTIGFAVENTCPIAVYPLIKIEGDIIEGDYIEVQRVNPDRYLRFDSSRITTNNQAIYIDNKNRCVYQYESGDTGRTLNRTSYLSPGSDFFSLYPGENKIFLSTGSIGSEYVVTLSWLDHYLGVNK